MAVPWYCRSRQGRVYRVLRSSERLDLERMRYTLRAVPIRAGVEIVEASCVIETEIVRDKIRLRQVIATPETTFEQLWQQLRLDVDAP